MRIYADFNAFTSQGMVDLHKMGTLRDLCAAQIRLRDGLSLTLYADSTEQEDLEIEATVQWVPASSSRGGYWGGAFDPEGFRDVPTIRNADVRTWFPCSVCRRNLAEEIVRAGLTADSTCPGCGTHVHAPIAPPVQGA